MQKKFEVRRWCTVPNRKSDGVGKFSRTGSVEGCSVLQGSELVGTRLRVDTTRVFFCRWFPSPIGAAGERPEFGIKPPSGAQTLIFSSRLSPKVFSTWGYFRKMTGV